MRLLVASNWDPALIEPLSKLGTVNQIFGVLPATTVGSGRPGSTISKMTPEQAEEYVRLAHSRGLKFDYLLNASCMGNMEWDEDTHRELLQHLDWISSIGVDSVTVTIPYLVELIKKQFPQLKVRVSTIAHVNSVNRAKFFESMGADSITLDFNINRDFRLLRAIKHAVSCELNLVLNDACLYQCPFRYYHYNSISHSTQPYNPLKGFYVEYHTIRCTIERYSDLSQFIKSRWIRPEDIEVYEDTGIDSFKISGRSMSTEWILNAAQAYSSRQYKGNLCDIVQAINTATKYQNPLSPLSRVLEMGTKLARHKDLISASQASAGLPPHLKLLENDSFRSFLQAQPPETYIDNQALDGFIDFFRKQDCLSGCAHCHYCQKIAGRVIRVDSVQTNEYLSVLTRFLNDLTGSRIFNTRSKDNQRRS
jgi:collagenase-like PrtC family protease